VEISKIKKEGVHAVCGVPGLYIRIIGNSHAWMFRAKFGGKGRNMGLGSCEIVTLAPSLTDTRQRLGHGDITPHGFRSTFRDWVGETTSYPREVVEQALAHKLKDKVEAAYQRGTFFEKRKGLISDWARECDTIRSAKTDNVVSIRKAV